MSTRNTWPSAVASPSAAINRLPRRREELVVVDLAAPLGVARGFAFFRIDEDVVDVRRHVQLAPAELAHADDHQPLRLAGGVERLAVLYGELAVDEIEREVGADVGEQRHRFDDFGKAAPRR